MIGQTFTAKFTRRMALPLLGVLAILGSGLLSSCGSREGKSGSSGSGSGSHIVATTTMITDMVREIAGDQVEVIGLMGPGVDPHGYKESAGDVATLHGAKAVFYNGIYLEGKMAETFDKIEDSGRPIVSLGESIPEEKLIDPSDGSGHADPHVWGDAGLWASTVPTVVEALVEVFPEDETGIRARGTALEAEYLALDAWAKEMVKTIPKDRRILITSHDAFGYLGRAYSLKVVGVQGISTVSEPGLADIVKMIDFIKENNIPAIFVESSTSNSAIERISGDSGAKVGGELFSDAMGAAGDTFELDGQTYDKGTYPGMFRYNVSTIVRALSAN